LQIGRKQLLPEQVNLANNPEYAAKLSEMKAELRNKLNTLPGTFGELKQ